MGRSNERRSGKSNESTIADSASNGNPADRAGGIEYRYPIYWRVPALLATGATHISINVLITRESLFYTSKHP